MIVYVFRGYGCFREEQIHRRMLVAVSLVPIVCCECPHYQPSAPLDLSSAASNIFNKLTAARYCGASPGFLRPGHSRPPFDADWLSADILPSVTQSRSETRAIEQVRLFSGAELDVPGR